MNITKDQLNSFDSRLQAETQTREAVQSRINMVQSQIDQLAKTIAATTTTPTMSSNNYSNGNYIPHTNNLNTNQPTMQPTIHPATQPPPFNYIHQVPSPNMLQMSAPQMNPMTQIINCLRTEMELLQNQFSHSEKSLNEMYEEVEQLKVNMNDRDQYDRRNNFILHGSKDVPIMPIKPKQEDHRKFTQYVVEKINKLFPGLEGGFTARDIDDTHIYRTKKSFRESNKQLIIVRLCSRLIRNEIFSMKRNLKGTGYSITEHLTTYNLQLLKAAQERMGDKKMAWTHYGKVLIDIDGKIKSIRNFDDLDYFTSR